SRTCALSRWYPSRQHFLEVCHGVVDEYLSPSPTIILLAKEASLVPRLAEKWPGRAVAGSNTAHAKVDRRHVALGRRRAEQRVVGLPLQGFQRPALGDAQRQAARR